MDLITIYQPMLHFCTKTTGTLSAHVLQGFNILRQNNLTVTIRCESNVDDVNKSTAKISCTRIKDPCVKHAMLALVIQFYSEICQHIKQYGYICDIDG